MYYDYVSFCAWQYLQYTNKYNIKLFQNVEQKCYQYLWTPLATDMQKIIKLYNVGLKLSLGEANF